MYHFGTENIMGFLKEREIYIFCAGMLGKEWKKNLEESGIEIKGFIDNNIPPGSKVDGMPVINIDSFKEINDKSKYIVICSDKYEYDIKKQLIENDIHNYMSANQIYVESDDYVEKVLTSQVKYWKDLGWFRSVKTKTSIDKNGYGLPWITYPCLEFLTARITKKMRVFEFSMGGSTDWFSRHCTEVISTEHDRLWFCEMQDSLEYRDNICLTLHEVTDEDGRSYTEAVYDESLKDDNGYSDEIIKYKDYFDIISIDGIARIRCTQKAIGALKSDGVILFDNSDRSDYDEAFLFLRSKGFKEIEFWGFGPCNQYRWKTSIFYRERNCLGI